MSILQSVETRVEALVDGLRRKNSGKVGCLSRTIARVKEFLVFFTIREALISQYMLNNVLTSLIPHAEQCSLLSAQQLVLEEVEFALQLHLETRE